MIDNLFERIVVWFMRRYAREFTDYGWVWHGFYVDGFSEAEELGGGKIRCFDHFYVTYRHLTLYHRVHEETVDLWSYYSEETC